MSNNEREATREDLVEVYKSYIDEMAKDSIEGKPANPKLIEDSNKVLNQIRNWDIIISIEKQKANSNNIGKVI